MFQKNLGPQYFTEREIKRFIITVNELTLLALVREPIPGKKQSPRLCKLLTFTCTRID